MKVGIIECLISWSVKKLHMPGKRLNCHVTVDEVY